MSFVCTNNNQELDKSSEIRELLIKRTIKEMKERIKNPMNHILINSQTPKELKTQFSHFKSYQYEATSEYSSVESNCVVVHSIDNNKKTSYFYTDCTQIHKVANGNDINKYLRISGSMVNFGDAIKSHNCQNKFIGEVVSPGEEPLFKTIPIEATRIKLTKSSMEISEIQNCYKNKNSQYKNRSKNKDVSDSSDSSEINGNSIKEIIKYIKRKNPKKIRARRNIIAKKVLRIYCFKKLKKRETKFNVSSKELPLTILPEGKNIKKGLNRCMSLRKQRKPKNSQDNIKSKGNLFSIKLKNISKNSSKKDNVKIKNNKKEDVNKKFKYSSISLLAPRKENFKFLGRTKQKIPSLFKKTKKNEGRNEEKNEEVDEDNEKEDDDDEKESSCRKRHSTINRKSLALLEELQKKKKMKLNSPQCPNKFRKGISKKNGMIKYEGKSGNIAQSKKSFLENKSRIRSIHSVNIVGHNNLKKNLKQNDFGAQKSIDKSINSNNYSSKEPKKQGFSSFLNNNKKENRANNNMIKEIIEDSKSKANTDEDEENNSKNSCNGKILEKQKTKNIPSFTSVAFKNMARQFDIKEDGKEKDKNNNNNNDNQIIGNESQRVLDPISENKNPEEKRNKKKRKSLKTKAMILSPVSPAKKFRRKKKK